MCGLAHSLVLLNSHEAVLPDLDFFPGEDFVSRRRLWGGRSCRLPLSRASACGAGQTARPSAPQMAACYRTSFRECSLTLKSLLIGLTAVCLAYAADEREAVRLIHARITAHPQTAKMQAYKVTIPNTLVSYGMAPIPAGDFTMGSSTGKKDEQPPHKVH